MTKTEQKLKRILHKIHLGKGFVVVINNKETNVSEQSREISRLNAQGVSVFRVSAASIWARPKAVIYSIYQFIKTGEAYNTAVVLTHNVTKYRNDRRDRYRRLDRLRPEELQRLDMKGRIQGGLSALLKNDTNSKLKPLS